MLNRQQLELSSRDRHSNIELGRAREVVEAPGKIGASAGVCLGCGDGGDGWGGGGEGGLGRDWKGRRKA